MASLEAAATYGYADRPRVDLGLGAWDPCSRVPWTAAAAAAAAAGHPQVHPAAANSQPPAQEEPRQFRRSWDRQDGDPGYIYIFYIELQI